MPTHLPNESQDGTLLAGCRASQGGLHLGHYYGCFFALPQTDKRPLFFVIGDCIQDTHSNIRKATEEVVLDVLAITENFRRSVFIARESAIRELLWPIFLDICSITLFRLLAEAHPRTRFLKTQTFSGTVSDFLFPIYQAAYTLGLDASLACFNDDNSRFVDLTRKISRRVNQKFFRKLRVDTQIIRRTPGRLLGCDGRRMAKGNSNTLRLQANKKEIKMFFTKLVGRTDQGVTDFASRPASELERLYLHIFCNAQNADGINDVVGCQRIDHASERAQFFLAELQAKRKRWANSSNAISNALEVGEAQAAERIETTKCLAGY